MLIKREVEFTRIFSKETNEKGKQEIDLSTSDLEITDE